MQAQSSERRSPPRPPLIDSLQTHSRSAESVCRRAVSDHDYITAEKLLLAEIERDPHSPRAARLLAYAGTVYFLNQDYMNAAMAWKKSEAIAPLDPQLRFPLAMAYIRMAHPDWARPVLESLAAQNDKDALYPYWLGRLDYDGINTTTRSGIFSTPSSWIREWPGLMTTWGFATTTRTRTNWR